jgi:hypothetical protein
VVMCKVGGHYEYDEQKSADQRGLNEHREVAQE